MSETASTEPRPEDVQEMLATIGALVIAMQTAEKAIGAGLSLAFPEGGSHSIETLSKDAEANSRATIGALIKKLEKRVDLADDFSDVLGAFLKGRNDLIHDYTRIEGFGWKTAEEVYATRVYLQNHLQNTEMVTKVFVALIHEWSLSVGFPGDNSQVSAYLGEWEGIASSVFFAKASGKP